MIGITRETKVIRYYRTFPSPVDGAITSLFLVFARIIAYSVGFSVLAGLAELIV